MRTGVLLTRPVSLRLSMALGLPVIAVVTTILMYVSPILADEPFDELRARIAQLEKDNLSLRSALSNTDDAFVDPRCSHDPKTGREQCGEQSSE